MGCYSPLRVWRGDLLPSGKRSIVFKRPSSSAAAFPFELPCGKCIGCRLEYSRQWALRCMDEASLYEKNCFVTLTYAPDKLPIGGSLEKREFQLFMKRLRKRYGDGIRFYAAGEYGETNGRPHYHVCLFNFRPDDLIHYSTNGRGDKLYISPSMDEVWAKGIVVIGDVTFESAAYVARYVMKKYKGNKSDDHYVNHETGEILPSEFVLMSRGSKKLGTGGIGKGWFNKFRSDCFPSDFRIHDGVKMLPPKFYEKIYSVENPEEYDKIKSLRKKRSLLVKDVNDSFRLAVKEEVHRRRISSLKREV